MSLGVRGDQSITAGGIVPEFLGLSVIMAGIPLGSAIPPSPRGWRKRNVLEEPLLNKSSFSPGTKLGEQKGPAEGKLNFFEAQFGESVNSPQKYTRFSTLPSFFFPPTIFLKRAGAGGAEEPRAFEMLFAADSAENLSY